MVGCWSCSHPGILVPKNLYSRVALVGPYCKKWSPSVLTLVLSQANHSSALLSVTVWEPWEPVTCGQKMHTRSSWIPKSTRRDGNSAELANATTNSDGKRRAIGDGKRYEVSPEQTVTVSGNSKRRQRISQTATMDVIDPPRRLPKQAQRIREPFQSATDASVATLQEQPLFCLGARLPTHTCSLQRRKQTRRDQRWPRAARSRARNRGRGAAHCANVRNSGLRRPRARWVRDTP